MNLNPEVWGPHAWFFLESVVIAMPDNLKDDQITNYQTFFNTLKYMLPCEGCRYHYGKYLEENPLTKEIVGKKDNMINWLFTLHNNVRVRNNSKPRTHQEIMDYYIAQYSKDSQTPKDNRPYYLLIILALMVIFYVCYLAKC